MTSQSVVEEPTYRIMQVENPTAAQKIAWKLGLDPVDDGVRVRIEQGTEVVLSGLRIITRTSGRLNRHLSRYLVGVDPCGTVYEFFIDVVKGIQSALFQFKNNLKKVVMRWLSPHGEMSLYELTGTNVYYPY